MNSKEKQIIAIICVAAVGAISITVAITISNNAWDAVNTYGQASNEQTTTTTTSDLAKSTEAYNDFVDAAKANPDINTPQYNEFWQKLDDLSDKLVEMNK